MARMAGPIGHCCYCIHRRTGTWLLVLLMGLYTVCGLFGLVSEDTRIVVGGYSHSSLLITDILAVLGIIAVICGSIGVMDNNTKWVRMFTFYVTIRGLFRILTFYMDFNMLRVCEKFTLSSVTEDQYNVAMEVVIATHSCGDRRVMYPIISVLDIFFSFYGVWNANFWCWAQEHGPMYHISLDESKALRIYTGYSSVGHPDAPPTVQVVPPESPEMPEEDPYGGNAYNRGPLAPPQSGYYGAAGSAQLPY